MSKIYSTPPSDKMLEEYREIIESIKRKNDELLSAKIELQQTLNHLSKIKKQKTDLSNLIFNRSELKNAKTIVAFSDGVDPFITDNYRKLKISIEYYPAAHRKKYWVYKIYEDENCGISNDVDEEYGLICDLSEDEIIKIGKERADKMFDRKKLADYRLLNADDKYLSERLMSVKKDLQKKRKSG
jgi:tRNA U34 5-carboxymethylaminomethyl modifying enzyme MnmG/GidA